MFMYRTANTLMRMRRLIRVFSVSHFCLKRPISPGMGSFMSSVAKIAQSGGAKFDLRETFCKIIETSSGAYILLTYVLLFRNHKRRLAL